MRSDQSIYRHYDDSSCFEDSDAEDSDYLDELNPKNWYQHAVDAAIRDGGSFDGDVKRLARWASEPWRKLTPKEQATILAQTTRSTLGDEGRVLLMNEPCRQQAPSPKWHKNLFKLDAGLRADSYVPVKEVKKTHPSCGPVLRRLYTEGLRATTDVVIDEDEWGLQRSKKIIRPFVMNKNNSFIALCALFCGQKPLNQLELSKVEFQLLTNAVQCAPYGTYCQIVVVGGNPLSKVDFAVQGETAGSVWDLLLLAFDLACDWQLRYIMEAFAKHALLINSHDILDMANKMYAGFSRKNRWKAMRYKIRDLGRRFLKSNLGTMDRPVRALFTATAKWLHNMLTEAYGVAKVSTLTKPEDDAKRFPIFATEYIQKFENQLRIMEQENTVILVNDTNVYSESLGLQARTRQVRDCENELATVNSAVIGVQAITQPAAASAAPPPTWASPGGRKTRKKGKRPNCRANLAWKQYANTYLAQCTNSTPKAFNKCNNCKKRRCWPCMIKKMSANVADVCAFTEANGHPFALSLTTGVGNYKFAVPLPGFIFPRLRCVPRNVTLSRWNSTELMISNKVQLTPTCCNYRAFCFLRSK